MSEQRTFAGLAWSAKGKVTRREQFLAEMNAVIPWARLLKRIEPHYPKPGEGRRPAGLAKMLRIYFVQQWFDLSDPAAEDAIYDSESIRRFVGVELGEDSVPDEWMGITKRPMNCGTYCPPAYRDPTRKRMSHNVQTFPT